MVNKMIVCDLVGVMMVHILYEKWSPLTYGSERKVLDRVDTGILG
jgi:hypothetical protein